MPTLKLEMEAIELVDFGQFGIDIPSFESTIPPQFETESRNGNTLGEHVEGEDDEIVKDADPNVMVRISIPASIWLGKRQEIRDVCDKIERRYMASIRIEE
jgi:hypothetical protein